MAPSFPFPLGWLEWGERLVPGQNQQVRTPGLGHCQMLSPAHAFGARWELETKGLVLVLFFHQVENIRTKILMQNGKLEG